MSACSRRDFLARSAAGALALGASSALPNLASAAEPAKMAIAKWSGAKELSAAELKDAAVKLTEKALEGIGGLKQFVTKGSVVWIKPNIGWDRTPELAANTNPDVIATLIRMCFDAGAKKVRVGDNPCDPAGKAYASSGLAQVAKEAGAEVLLLDKDRFRDTAIKGERIKTHKVFPAILESDLVINVPIVKHHTLAKATLCMKNYMGVIENRGAFHQDIPTCLADITRFMKPQICILDAIRILKANGPKGGNLKDVELKMTLAAGTDIVALDAWGAEVMGRKPSEIKSIVKGAEVGLGKIDYKAIAKEIAVS